MSNDDEAKSVHPGGWVQASPDEPRLPTHDVRATFGVSAVSPEQAVTRIETWLTGNFRPTCPGLLTVRVDPSTESPTGLPPGFLAAAARMVAAATDFLQHASDGRDPTDVTSIDVTPEYRELNAAVNGYWRFAEDFPRSITDTAIDWRTMAEQLNARITENAAMYAKGEAAIAELDALRPVFHRQQEELAKFKADAEMRDRDAKARDTIAAVSEIASPETIIQGLTFLNDRLGAERKLLNEQIERLKATRRKNETDIQELADALKSAREKVRDREERHGKIAEKIGAMRVEHSKELHVLRGDIAAAMKEADQLQGMNRAQVATINELGEQIRMLSRNGTATYRELKAAKRENLLHRAAWRNVVERAAPLMNPQSETNQDDTGPSSPEPADSSAERDRGSSIGGDVTAGEFVTGHGYAFVTYDDEVRPGTVHLIHDPRAHYTGPSDDGGTPHRSRPADPAGTTERLSRPDAGDPRPPAGEQPATRAGDC